jgi:hypothetical protein
VVLCSCCEDGSETDDEEEGDTRDRDAVKSKGQSSTTRRGRETSVPSIVSFDRNTASFSVSYAAMSRTVRAVEVLGVVQEQDMLDRFLADVDRRKQKVHGLGEVGEGDEAERAAWQANEVSAKVHKRKTRTDPNG